MNNNLVPMLLILGIAGVAVYLFTRPNPIAVPPPVVAPPIPQCGASYAGTGVSVPCSLVANGIKSIVSNTEKVLSKYGVTQQAKVATKDFGVADVALFPVAINHTIYNETLGRIF